jgi:glycine/D-amino acid oxidase-like deaminating enzyme
LNSDVAVIGSGPVGLYLSLLLAKRGFRVVIIEAGGLGIESSHLNQTKYLFNTPSSLPKNAHMFGGGGNLWFRRIGEFLKRDFLPVSGVREECWPIEYDQLSVYASEVRQ